ncbi:MAG: serine/threonine-protein kinase [Myxococcales bacterium]|jgi:hypothetical protein
MAGAAMTREKIAGEALTILSTLRDNARSGRSNKLADVKSAFEPVVSLEFDTYFFFLRKYHYIGMDREACLQLTPEGERIVEGDRRERFIDAVQEYFSGRIAEMEGPVAEILADSSMIAEEHTPPPPMPLPPPQPVVEEPTKVAAAQATPAPEPRPVAPPPRPRLSRDAEVAPAFPAAPPPAVKNEARPEPKGQEIDLRYVKYDAIGQGPLGTVYRGRHTALGLDVAIKELKDIFGYFSFLQRGEVIKRLKREICAQAVVRHPAIAPILDQNCDVARPFFVIELCPGGSLADRLAAAGGKGMAPEEAIRIFLQLAYGLRAAHAHSLTHGNIKPENVLFDAMGNAKLADFGLSRVIEVDTAKGMPQVFVGTGGMGYMSPEQLARSTKDLGPASDVYAVGILFYEMLTGQLPGRRSPLPSAVNDKAPEALDSLFDKMTQDRREARYPDFDAVLDDFYAAFGDGSYLKRGDLILSSEVRAAGGAEAKASE